MIFRRPRMESDRRKSPRDILLAGFALCYGIYFVRLMLFGLKSWFSGDDLLNLHYVWSRPVSDLLRGNIFFFNHYQRPMGEAFLYLLYLVFGFNPGPYNVVRLLLCVSNVCILYLAAERLSGSREVEVFTVMLAGFHPQLNSVYYDSGMIFDALAFFFFYSALALYAHYRRDGRMPGAIQSAPIVLLYIAALASKEIAVSFPVALLLYELTIGTGRFSRRIRLVLITGFLTLIYVVGKNTGPGSLSAESAYHPEISLAGYIHTYAHYAGEFLRDSGYLPDSWAAFALAGCLALALLLRNRLLIWAALFNLFSILPIAFIPPRNGFAFLVPLAGWGIFGGALMADLLQRLLGYTRSLRIAGQAAVALALFFVVLRPEEKTLRRYLYPVVHQEQFANLETWHSLQSVLPANPGNKKILALHDPFENGYYLMFLAHLGFNNPALVVDTPRTLSAAGRMVSREGYDYVIDYDQGTFFRVPANVQ